MVVKTAVRETAGTLKKFDSTATGVTAKVILILGVLTFFPVLALGPPKHFKLIVVSSQQLTCNQC